MKPFSRHTKTGSGIPRVIHLCWLSGDPYPPLIERCIASWRRSLPHYEIRIWNRDSFDIEAVPWVAEAVAKRKYAFAADYIRLFALYTQGGVYLDADVEVFRSLDPLLGARSFIGFETGGDLEPAVIGSEAGVEWLRNCLLYYEGRHFILPDGRIDQKPLPLIVGETLRRYPDFPAQAVNLPTDVAGGDLMLYPASHFSPKHLYTGAIQASLDTYCVHHFDGQWIDRNWKQSMKSSLHRAAATCLGPSGHRRLVSVIRRWKG